MEKGGGKSYRSHVVMLAYHGQGHINPMVQFSKRLASKGVKVTVATTLSNTEAMQQTAVGAGGFITFESIYDDLSEGGVGGPGGFKGFLDRFEATGYRCLTELIRQKNTEYPAVKCLVYDANITWASNIPRLLSIRGAAFFTQSCAAVASYYPMLYNDDSSLPLPAFSMPGLPPPKIPDLPSFGSSSDGRYPPIIRYILSQFDGIENADWVIFNSFHLLEEEVVKWMLKLWKGVRTIGPMVPSIYLDKRVEDDDAYGFSLYETNSDACMTWLNGKEKGSVVYISFGSTAGSSLSSEQMGEMAEALLSMNDKYSFLWVVKESEERKLPSNFVEETNKKQVGLVVRWCPQLEVLAHPGVGCFVSHCGWNSTLEAISFGVPMVAMPQILDQITNAYFVEKVWQVGVRPKLLSGDNDDEGAGGAVATSQEIGRCIDEVLTRNGEKEEDNNMKKNAVRWKEFAAQAISEGGTSDMNINEIIGHIVTPSSSYDN